MLNIKLFLPPFALRTRRRSRDSTPTPPRRRTMAPRHVSRLVLYPSSKFKPFPIVSASNILIDASSRHGFTSRLITWHKATSKSNLLGHIRAVHEKRRYGGETFPCPSCNYKAKHKGSLKIHMEAIHNGLKHQCPNCKYTSSYKDKLRIHIKSVHEGFSLPCPHCNYKASQKSHLLTHIQSVHEKQRQRYPCLHCDYSATKKRLVRRHVQKIHERALLIHCPVCDFIAESQSLLQRHTKSIHKGFTLCKLWINISDGRYHPYIWYGSEYEPQ